MPSEKESRERSEMLGIKPLHETKSVNKILVRDTSSLRGFGEWRNETPSSLSDDIAYYCGERIDLK